MFLGQNEITNVEQVEDGVIVSFANGTEVLSQEAFDTLQTEESSDDYPLRKVLWTAGQVYQVLVKEKVGSINEAGMVLNRAARELESRADRAVAVMLYGKEDEHANIRIDEIDAKFKQSL